ncbi:MAG TPA: response regulator transcription factor [bacterium]|jgi:DNA-binding response OmpR family regulator|nr:response regulator transcription factor [bacterium]
MAAKKLILIIDDDQKLNELLKSYLVKFEMNVTAATHPNEGLDLLKKRGPDLVILDVMLPGKDGFAVCKEIRKASKVPIIMLTARGDVTDRVVGLEIGADDYLPKPFEPRELVARIQTVLRRLSPSPAPGGGLLKSDGLTADLGKRAATLKGKDLGLTTTEFEILAFFMKNPGIVLNRDRIMEYLKGIECEAFNRSIDIAVSRLRKKLKDPANRPKFFKTVWGEGYLFVGRVMAHA